MRTNTPPKRWWDIWSALFLVFALMSAATRLYNTQWTSDLERVQYLTLIGAILGLALGQSRFSTRVVRIFATVYTLFFIPWQLGSMQGENIWWGDRITGLGIRLQVAARQFSQSKAVDDSILFLLLMIVLFWLLSLIAGYYLTRYGNYWAGLISSGIGLLIINHYDPANTAWVRLIGAFLLFSLLLIGRMTYLRRKSEWQVNGISQPPETASDFSRALVAFVVVVFLLAWTVPAVAASSSSARKIWSTLTDPWEKLRDRVDNAVTSLRSSFGAVSDFYGDSMALGTGTFLGDDIVFTVKANSEKPPGARYYWRARSYDTYEDGNWGNNDTESISYIPSNVSIQSYDWAARQQIQFVFQPQISMLQTFYTPAIPLYLDQPGEIFTEKNTGNIMDVVRVGANPPLAAGSQYTVISWIAVPSEPELYSSSTDYPEWVTEKYLQLPEGLSDRIPQLAQEIAGDFPDPYDKTLAITTWLRENITYTTDIPTPPDGQDPLEWFLFDYRQGYCNYYASAEVIMLRSLGIPARLAVGYAQGEIDEGRNLYTVRNKDAHAWPEVYFEGYGWIEFEPTVSQVAREFPLSAGLGEDVEGGANAMGPDLPLPSLDTIQAQEAIAERSKRLIQWRISLIAGSAGGLGLLLFLGWRYARQRMNVPALPVYLEQRLSRSGAAVPEWLKNWSKRVNSSPLEKAYNSVNQSLRLLGQPPQPSNTPNERAAHLSKLAPATEEPANYLVGEYERGTYSPYPVDVEGAKKAGSQVRWLSWKSWLYRLLHEK